MEKTCNSCQFHHDWFGSCFNPESENRGEIMMGEDSCPEWKGRENMRWKRVEPMMGPCFECPECHVLCLSVKKRCPVCDANMEMEE